MTARVQRQADEGSTFVFPATTNSVLRARWRILRGLMKHGDDPSFIVHILRRMCDSAGVQGCPDEVRAGLEGGGVISTTIRYAHLLPNASMAAMAALEPA